MRAAILFALAAPLFAQDGEKLFASNCSVPYCHGANGTQGRAPKLVGHSFSGEQLSGIISNGISAKGMPPFGGQLSSAEINAVVRYLMTMRGTGASAAPGVAAPDSAGKALFFDAVRMGGCGRCHELEKRGSAVAPLIQNIPADLAAIATGRVVTAAPKGDAAFPGLVLEDTEKRVRVYDLSSPLPVLRTFSRGSIEITPGAKWTHREAVSGYSNSELREVSLYLRGVVR
jgi:mono/diheme cytochrome c family protein